MANNIVQAILEVIGTLSCCYGTYSIYGSSSNIISFIYNGLWFILGFLSNITGLGAIMMECIKGDEMNVTTHNYLLQYHYLFSWFTVILGYPTLVTQFWLSYYPTPSAHILVALSLLPMVAWATQNTTIIVGTTQASTGFAISAHFYICYLAGNNYGLIGACIMILMILSLSLPTRYSLWGFSSREGFVVGLAVVSYIFAVAVSHIVKNPVIVQSLKPYTPSTT